MLNASKLFERPIEEISVKNAARIISEAAHEILNLTDSTMPKFMSSVYSQFASLSVGKRPNRQEPRAVKRRRKPTPLLHERRCDWQAKNKLLN
jgi:hypothetical protein